MAEILVGCAGWHYKDWAGPVYPPALDAGRWLEAYAALFPVAEVDSTFYGLPTERTVEGWIERTQSLHFSFAPKLSQEATHEHVPRGEVEPAKAVAGAFLDRVVRPLETAGRFEAVLAQLPPTFDAFGKPGRPDPMESLLGLVEALEPKRRRVAVEFRHPSWYDHVGERLAAEAAESLGALGAAAVHVDGLGSHLSRTRTADWSYFRFHGRRRSIPDYERGMSHAPYDYLYSDAEIQELATAIAASAAADAKTLVIFNNHYRAQAARNAQDLMGALGLGGRRARISVSKDRSLDEFAAGKPL